MADIVIYMTLSLLLSVFVIGIPGNLTIIRVYMGHKRKTSTEVLVISLAISDGVFCLTIPLYYVNLLAPCDAGTNASCKIGTSIYLITIYYSILLTGAIAMDRYYAVCQPLSRKITPKKALVIAVICFVISLFIGGTLGYDSSIVEERTHGGTNATNETIVCRKCVAAKGIGERESYLGLLVAAVYAAVIFVFVAVAVLYALVYRSVRRQAKVRAAMGFQETRVRNEQNISTSINSFSIHTDTSTNSGGGGDFSSSSGQQQNAETDAAVQRKRNSSQIMQQKITRMLVLMTIIIWGTWTPSVILIFFNRWDPEYVTRLDPGGQAMVKFCNFLYLINYGVNIIVYLTTNDRFRQEAVQILRNKCRRLPKVYR